MKSNVKIYNNSNLDTKVVGYGGSTIPIKIYHNSLDYQTGNFVSMTFSVNDSSMGMVSPPPIAPSQLGFESPAIRFDGNVVVENDFSAWTVYTKPSKGYKFSHWLLNGQKPEDNVMYILREDSIIQAVFEKEITSYLIAQNQMSGAKIEWYSDYNTFVLSDGQGHTLNIADTDYWMPPYSKISGGLIPGHTTQHKQLLADFSSQQGRFACVPGIESFKINDMMSSSTSITTTTSALTKRNWTDDTILYSGLNTSDFQFMIDNMGFRDFNKWTDADGGNFNGMGDLLTCLNMCTSAYRMVMSGQQVDQGQPVNISGRVQGICYIPSDFYTTNIIFVAETYGVGTRSLMYDVSSNNYGYVDIEYPGRVRLLGAPVPVS